jgi:hypothetical protein
MTKVAIAEEFAAKIRDSEGAVELVDSSGHTIGVVRRPPTSVDIERARSRASQDGKRLSWDQVVEKVKGGAKD